MNQNICFLSHPYHRGGVTQWMVNAFNAWNRELSEAYFVSVRPRSPFQSGKDRPLIVSLLDKNYLHRVVAEDVGFSFEFGTMQYRAYRYRQFVLFNVPEGIPIVASDDEACWMAAASLVDRNPFFAVIHSYGDTEYYNLLDRYQGAVRGIVCVSSRIAALVAKKFSDERFSNIEVLPCGVPMEFSEGRIASKKHQIVWVGRMEEKSKRVSDLPRVIKGLDDILKNLEIHIVGDGSMLGALREFISTYRGPNQIFLHGWKTQEETLDILRSSKLLLQTSNYEGMSLSVMEALACGCAVVSSRVSGVEDLEYKNGSEGVINLFDVGDVDGAVGRIKDVFANYDSTVPLRAQVVARENFDINRTNSKLAVFIENSPSEKRSARTTLIPVYAILISPILAFLRYVKVSISARNVKKLLFT